jgi:histidinol-phosphatase
MYEHEHAFALGLADRAASIGMSIFRHEVIVKMKSDQTPVTQADTLIEEMVREQVGAAFPDDRIFGEEEGGEDPARGRVWVVDPIDATANFARGIPIWATLIALQVDGEPMLGVVNAPAIGERYDAVVGGGARENGDPIGVSSVGTIADSQILFAGVEPWAEGRREAVEAVFAEAKRTRGFGDFWGHMLVARGAAGDMVERELSLWDFAALVPVVREAGGRITTIEGGPPVHGGSVVSANAAIHDELIRRLNPD